MKTIRVWNRLKLTKTLIIKIMIPAIIFSGCQLRQDKTPAESRNFKKPSAPDEVIDFMKNLAMETDHFTYFEAGNNSVNQPIGGLMISAGNFGENPEKLKILIFAQQHGNEQSGMEGCLLWINSLKNDSSILDKTDICIIPQVNPWGAENNERRNPDDFDLNRDHMLLSQPETQAIHSVFHRFNFHVTIDMHEYFPLSDSWMEFGARKDFDMQIGSLTNPNTSKQLREFAYTRVLPHMEEKLEEHGHSFFNYLVGPAPNEGDLRHSTADINDGRQSFGIQNTLSFIFEGKNGKDRFTDNLKERANVQFLSLKHLLDFLYENTPEVKLMVEFNRSMLKNEEMPVKTAIRIEHINAGQVLQLPLVSTSTGNDTLVEVSNYNYVVIPTLEVETPQGYLIPDTMENLIDLLERQNIEYRRSNSDDISFAKGYFVEKISSSEDEGLENRFPSVAKQDIGIIDPVDYIYVPLQQQSFHKIVIILEPQSMYGIVNTEPYQDLLKEGEMYPILRADYLF